MAMDVAKLCMYDTATGSQATYSYGRVQEHQLRLVSDLSVSDVYIDALNEQAFITHLEDITICMERLVVKVH